MDSKELRIGNLLLMALNNDTIITVVGLTKECISVSGAEKNRFTPLKSDLVKGIPLTEKWLIKLGFIQDTETTYRWFLKDWLAYDLDDNCIRITGSWEFGKRQFVHQLQNLYFVLTGEELDVKE